MKDGREPAFTFLHIFSAFVSVKQGRQQKAFQSQTEMYFSRGLKYDTGWLGETVAFQFSEKYNDSQILLLMPESEDDLTYFFQWPTLC